MLLKLYTGLKKKLLQGTERTEKAKKSILKMFMNKGLSIILSMMYVPLFLDCLDKTRYGIWIAIMGLINWIGFLDIGIGQGLRNLLSVSLAKGDNDTAKKLVSTAYVSVGTIFSVLIILFLSAYNFVDWYKIVNAPTAMANEINILVLFVVCLMCVNFILGVIKSVFFAFQEPQKNSDMSLITQALSLLVVFIFSKVGRVDNLLPIGFTLTLIPCIVYFGYSVYFFAGRFKHVAPSFKHYDRQ